MAKELAKSCKVPQGFLHDGRKSSLKSTSSLCYTVLGSAKGLMRSSKQETAGADHLSRPTPRLSVPGKVSHAYTILSGSPPYARWLW